MQIFVHHWWPWIVTGVLLWLLVVGLVVGMGKAAGRRRPTQDLVLPPEWADNSEVFLPPGWRL